MLFEKFSKEVLHAFNPKDFHNLVDAGFWDGIKYFTKILVLAYIIMAILLIPKAITLKNDIRSELAKFDAVSISGTVTQSDTIRIPGKEPLIIIDATGDEITPGKERITITRDSLFYKFFAGRKEIPLTQIKEMDPGVMSRLLLYLFIFILPSIVFFSFGGIWLKYFIFALLIGTLVFLMSDLTRFTQSWKTCVKSTCYAATLIILVETISSALYAKWMLPLFSFWNFHIYLVPLVAWLVLSLAFVVCLHTFNSKRRHAKH